MAPRTFNFLFLAALFTVNVKERLAETFDTNYLQWLAAFWTCPIFLLNLGLAFRTTGTEAVLVSATLLESKNARFAGATEPHGIGA